MTIHRAGRGTILSIWAFCALMIYLVLHFIDCVFISYPLAGAFIFFMGFVLYFFRVPDREKVSSEKAVTSVADGEVVIIEKVYEN